MVYFIWKSKFFRQRVYTILGGDLMDAFLIQLIDVFLVSFRYGPFLCYKMNKKLYILLIK
jgi:hypothetical protein